MPDCDDGGSSLATRNETDCQFHKYLFLTVVTALLVLCSVVKGLHPCVFACTTFRLFYERATIVGQSMELAMERQSVLSGCYIMIISTVVYRKANELHVAIHHRNQIA